MSECKWIMLFLCLVLIAGCAYGDTNAKNEGDTLQSYTQMDKKSRMNMNSQEIDHSLCKILSNYIKLFNSMTTNKIDYEHPFEHWKPNVIKAICVTSKLKKTPEYKSIPSRSEIDNFIKLAKSLRWHKANMSLCQDEWFLYITTDGEKHSILLANGRVQIDGIWYNLSNETQKILLGYFNSI